MLRKPQIGLSEGLMQEGMICIFCRRSRGQAYHFLDGIDGGVCPGCIVICYQMLDKIGVIHGGEYRPHGGQEERNLASVRREVFEVP